MGEVTEKETKTITDNDQEMVKLEKIIKVNCAIPSPHNGYFYDYTGKVNTEKIKSFLGKNILFSPRKILQKFIFVTMVDRTQI